MPETSGEFPPAYEMDELLHIADAIAKRDLQELETAQNLAAEITGQPAPEVPLEIRHKIATASAAMYITRVETPGAQMSFEDSIDAVMHGSYAHLADMFSDGTEVVTESQVRDFMKNFGKTILNAMGITEEEAAEMFAKTFSAAKVVAEEKGVGVGQVYQDEELYSGIFRKAYTPEEFVTQHLATMEGISVNTMNAMVVHLLNLMIPEEEQAEMDEKEMAEMSAELQLDPEVQTATKQAVEMGLKAANHVAVSQIMRFWGTNALRSLPEEIQQKLCITNEPSVIEIGGFAISGASAEQADQLKMRESFVNRYFEERGWDVSNPSIDQLMEVRSQHGWQNPSA